jgi:single-strand DNA-binding protein
MSVNQVTILGRLGADPEVKTITSGQTVAQLSVATSERWKDRDGNQQERTEWHRVVVWGKLAEVIGEHFSKGSEIFLQGKLQTRSWEDQQGQKKYTTEIVANNFSFTGGSKASAGGGNRPPAPEFGPEPSFDSNEEIPF